MQVVRMRIARFATNIPDTGSIVIDRLRAERTRFAIVGSGSTAASDDLGRLSTDIAGRGEVDTRAAIAVALVVPLPATARSLRIDGPVSGRLAGSGRIVIGGRPLCTITNPGGGRSLCPAAR